MKKLIVLLFTIFIFVGTCSVSAEELPMSTGNVLKLQIASLQIALMQEKQLRAQDRQALIRVLDLWGQ